ncbi:MAG: cytochrome c oxidase subunit II [Casimicrobiaceae bacterium]|nr:cytochrome c oxidase subunit II [Casimicrobiaceae bacterium]MCX8097678.1 cytochrome c oxidase subunit II [Casimicrobiaceae bacterium]
MLYSLLRVIAACLALATALPVLADWAINLPPPNSSVAQKVYDLHLLITGICAVIFCVVFGVMFYSLYAHRRSKGHQAANFHESTTVEVIWTVIPFLILLGMAYPATKTLLEMRDSSAPELTIKVTGYQWKWGYDYIHEGFGFMSTLSTPLAQIMGDEKKGEHYLLEVDNPLVVPVGTKVRLLVTAQDVIHAWWVPALGVKQDAIPGFVRDTWFRADRPGVFRGNCAELCGKEHGFMPIVVDVKTKADYEKWLAAEKEKRGLTKSASATAAVDTKVYDKAELIAHGEQVYQNAGCLGCHQANGKGTGNFPPLDGSKVAIGEKDALIALLLNGKPGTAMASFKHLSDKDLAAVSAYIGNAWSNKRDDLLQPLDFAKARHGGKLPSGSQAGLGTGISVPEAVQASGKAAIAQLAPASGVASAKSPAETALAALK